MIISQLEVEINHKMTTLNTSADNPPLTSTVPYGMIQYRFDLFPYSHRQPMTTKIDKKIVGYSVVDKNTEHAIAKEIIDQMHEKVERPECLAGCTYKVKTPLSDHALYITINDIVLNQGTAHEIRRPFEIFINSKNMDHFQWIVALTRIISAVFRKGGDSVFLIDQLRSIYDPHGGYIKKGGRYTPSLVAEIGDTIETHMRSIGMLADEGIDNHLVALIESKRVDEVKVEENDSGDYPSNAVACQQCHVKSAVLMDNCITCLNCGYSKCG